MVTDKVYFCAFGVLLCVGSFVSGSNSDVLYNGANFVAQNSKVIIVAPNYRWGVFFSPFFRLASLRFVWSTLFCPFRPCLFLFVSIFFISFSLAFSLGWDHSVLWVWVQREWRVRPILQATGVSKINVKLCGGSKWTFVLLGAIILPPLLSSSFVFFSLCEGRCFWGTALFA